jgi:hypothetical protein
LNPPREASPRAGIICGQGLLCRTALPLSTRTLRIEVGRGNGWEIRSEAEAIRRLIEKGCTRRSGAAARRRAAIIAYDCV